ncbi:MAG: DNA repair protein RecN [Gammaproteobacteria bacterium]|nr:DNA repair protein RecN [Gammaproteobacteria bacterium]
MLTELHIRNFAIVDELSVDFSTGLTTLTGETGAGKSIAIDALAIALGDRVDSSMLRTGSDRGEVVACFDIRQQSNVQLWLTEHELDEDGACILRRTLAENGSKAYINGRPISVSLLRELGAQLVDIYSQHQHQSMLQKDQQRELLDDYAQNDTVLKQVRGVYRQWQQINQQLQQLEQAKDQREQRLDYLSFQLQELDALELKPNEWAQLDAEHRQLAHAEQIQTQLSSVLSVLYDSDDNLLSQLNRCINVLNDAQRYLPQASSPREMLENARIQIDEATAELRDQWQNTELDPARLQWLDERISELNHAARKHRCDPEQLVDVHQQISDELHSLKHSDQQLEQLQQQRQQLHAQYRQLAQQLTVARQAAAKKLSQQVDQTIHQLGMGNARFQVEMVASDASQPTAHGQEDIQFLICTNPGQPFKPLAKVASGGELSRLALAIQVATSQVARIPTLIFDEVDVGIGGGVAQIVGNMLRQLANNRQIVCITHQAQVAAQGNQQFKVEKIAQKESTSTRILLLEGQQRVEELARMIGGVELTETTRNHAREMLERATV